MLKNIFYGIQFNNYKLFKNIQNTFLQYSINNWGRYRTKIQSAEKMSDQEIITPQHYLLFEDPLKTTVKFYFSIIEIYLWHKND